MGSTFFLQTIFRGDTSMSEEKPVKRAKLISAMRNYKRKRTMSQEKMIDFTVSPSEEDKKILIRAIIEPKSKTGYTNVDTVREMVDFLEKNKYDKDILIGNKFTNAAKREMKKANIEMVSDSISLNFKMNRLYSTIVRYVEKLCKMKCGKVPSKDSDCKGFVDAHYSCDIRLISGNADFHYEKAWVKFLERDLVKLLTIEKELRN
jgi:hypothetical protein